MGFQCIFQATILVFIGLRRVEYPGAINNEEMIMMNLAHFNMLEQQIRPWDVHSPRLLEVIADLDRAQFVPTERQELCYTDTEIMLEDGTKMLEPKVAARLVQALDLKSDDRILLLGVGSGYTAALCSKMAYTVDCVDTDQAALDQAAYNSGALAIKNIHYYLLDNLNQLSDDKEYDAILIRQPRSSVPEEYFAHLASGGRCVALVGEAYVMEMMRYTRQGKQISAESMTDILKPINDAVSPQKVFDF